MSPKAAPDPVKTVPAASPRERMLRVAKQLFASRGYEHASTSAIARLAASSESQLIKYFGSKAGLLEAIFVDGWATLTGQARQAIESAPNPARKLDLLTVIALEGLERDPDFKKLLLLESRRIRKEGQTVAISDGFMGFVTLVDEVLNEMRSAKLLRRGISVHAVRSGIMGLLEGMLRDRFLAEQSGYPADYDVAQMNEILALTMRAFTVSPQQAR